MNHSQPLPSRQYKDHKSPLPTDGPAFFEGEQDDFEPSALSGRKKPQIRSHEYGDQQDQIDNTRHRRSTSLAHSTPYQSSPYSPHQPSTRRSSRSSPSAPVVPLQQQNIPSPSHFTQPSSSQQPQIVPPMVDSPPETAYSRYWAFYQKNKGLAYVLLAQVFGTLMNVTTRLLEIEGNHGKGMHPFQILFVRMAITTVLSTIYMWYTQIPHFPFGLPEVRWLLALRGIGGFFGVFGMYYSLLYLPLADATVITFIAPSLSCWACSILIKEPYTRMEQIGAFVSFIGVTLIARPSSLFQRPQLPGEAAVPGADSPGAAAGADGSADAAPTTTGHAHDFRHVTSSQRAGAVGVALIGVLGSAAAFTTMRWIGKRAHPLLSVNYFSAWCTVVSGMAMAVLPTVEFLLPADGKEWGYLIFLGICGFTMQFLLAAGLQHEKSSRATNMVYTQMLFALFFDKLVFGTNPSLLSLAGSSLILGSAIYVAIQKETMKQKAEEEKNRRENALASGNHMEMRESGSVSTNSRRGRSRDQGQLKEEERGLVEGMDMMDEEEKSIGERDSDTNGNGHAIKPVG